MWSTRGISFWANGGWIHVTIHKQRGLEEDGEADYGDMEEKVYVLTEKLGETMDVDHSISCRHVNFFVYRRSN